MHDLRRLLGFIRPYALLSVLALVLLAAVVAMDLAIPRLIERIIDQGILKQDRRLVLSTAALMLGISAVSAVIAIGNNNFSVRVGEGVARDLRRALFLKMQSYSAGNLDRQRTGQLLVRLTSDVNAVKALTQVSLRIGTRAPLLMMGSLVLMVSTSRRLALILLPLLLLTSLLIAFFVLKMGPLFRLVQQRLDLLNTVLQENIAGARLIKAFVRAEHEGERFETANQQMTQQSIRVMQFMSSMAPSLTMCINLGVVIVIGLGGVQVIDHQLSMGQIVAFINYLLTTMTPLVMMTMLSSTWATGLVSLRRIHEILDTVPEVREAPGALTLPAASRAEVNFERVSFRYTEKDCEAVLREISLCAAPGKTIAILGATGAGKSTLVSLIPRLYEVSSGAVSVGGHDVRELSRKSLLSEVGFVPQQALLFSGTVRDNIRYGRPEASEQEVVLAARTAQAEEFIGKLPDGYDSRVEQRGENFSGGQKQRLALARAILLEPKILILDDSTSAVDVETENKIQLALSASRAQRTTFIVAQRISTVLGADTIIVLDKGRVVARGTHRELMETSAAYREIYDSQLGEGLAEDQSLSSSLPGANG